MPGISSNVVTIADGASLSNRVPLGSSTLVGLYLPVGMEGAKLLFLASKDKAETASQMDMTAPAFTAGRYLPLDYTNFIGVEWLEIRSVQADGITAQVQTGDATITLSVREML